MLAKEKALNEKVVQKDDKKLLPYIAIASGIFGFMTFIQPRLIVSGILITLLWILVRKPWKSASLLIVTSLLITLFFPATLIYRSNQAIGINSISTNLGVTMNIGAGDNAAGGYIKEGYGVDCDLSGNPSQQDNQRVS